MSVNVVVVCHEEHWKKFEQQFEQIKKSVKIDAKICHGPLQAIQGAKDFEIAGTKCHVFMVFSKFFKDTSDAYASTMFKAMRDTYKAVGFAFGPEGPLDKLGKKYHYYLGEHGAWNIKEAVKTFASIADGSFNAHGYTCEGPVKGYNGKAPTSPPKRTSLEGRRSVDGSGGMGGGMHGSMGGMAGGMSMGGMSGNMTGMAMGGMGGMGGMGMGGMGMGGMSGSMGSPLARNSTMGSGGFGLPMSPTSTMNATMGSPMPSMGNLGNSGQLGGMAGAGMMSGGMGMSGGLSKPYGLNGGLGHKPTQVDLVAKVEDMVRNGVPVHMIVKDLAAEVQRLIGVVNAMS